MAFKILLNGLGKPLANILTSRAKCNNLLNSAYVTELEHDMFGPIPISECNLITNVTTICNDDSAVNVIV